MKRYGSGLFILFFLMVLSGVSVTVWAGIANTKHNLSASGTGSIKATSEQEICVFCHFPHSAYPAEPL